MGQATKRVSGSDKVIALQEAAKYIEDGEALALGGMTLYRRPAAFARELVRRGMRGLTLIAFTGGYESDLLIGAGCVSCLRSCYFGFEAFGLAPMFTALSGKLQLVEETEATLTAGLKATIGGLPFMPVQALFGTDILKIRKDIQTFACPLTARPLVAVPALPVDTAVIHVPFADASGNAVLGGQYAVDRELALAARRVILTAERIVPMEVVAAAGADILGLRVDAVVACPGGAHPTSCWPQYPLAGDHLLSYLELCRNGDFAGYIDRCGADEETYQRRFTPAAWRHDEQGGLTRWQKALEHLAQALSSPEIRPLGSA